MITQNTNENEKWFIIYAMEPGPNHNLEQPSW